MQYWIKNNLVPLFFVLGLLLPQSQVGFLIQATLPFILVLVCGNLFKKPLGLLVTLVGIICISYFITVTEMPIPQKGTQRMIYLCAMFIIFPFTNYSKIKTNYLYFVFTVIFLSQLIFVFNIEGLKEFIDQLWPNEIEKYSASRIAYVSDFSSELQGLRYGGLFRNPNQCARYLTLIYAIYAIESTNIVGIKKYLFIFLVFFSIILTGSRTGLVVFGCVFVFSTFKIGLVNQKAILRYLSASLLIFSFIVFFLLIQTRSVDITESNTGSMAQKIENLSKYWGNIVSVENLPRILFGYFSIELTNELDLNIFDSEIGNMLYSVGVVGFVLIIAFYAQLIFKKDKNLYIILIILLWILSSSVLFSYRMSFVYLLVLSNYYSLYLDKKNKELT